MGPRVCELLLKGSRLLEMVTTLHLWEQSHPHLLLEKKKKKISTTYFLYPRRSFAAFIYIYITHTHTHTYIYIYIFERIKVLHFFLRELQLIAFALNDNSLLSDQNTNWFLVQANIEPHISYSTIRDFTSFVYLKVKINLFLENMVIYSH